MYPGIKLKSPKEALQNALKDADEYKSVLIIGLTKQKLNKSVKFFGNDIDFQLIASVVNGMSVDVAMQRIIL